MRACGICQCDKVDQEANLCTQCADGLSKPIGFCAEQLLSTALHPTKSVLLDSWGRVHFLEEVTPIGRRPVSRGIAILESSVSRNHSEIVRDAKGVWTIRDVGSRNGTTLQGEVLNKSEVLSGVCMLGFGGVGLYFIEDSSHLITDAVVASTVTIRPEDKTVMEAVKKFGCENEAKDLTFAGFPRLAVRLYQPSLGGGGFLELGGTKLQLTVAQYDLMSLLVQRMKEDEGQVSEVRGFTPSSLLISEISWDSPYPTENHLKQLIRRVRRLLEGAGLGNLIESKRGFGYRLRCIPLETIDPSRNI